MPRRLRGAAPVVETIAEMQRRTGWPISPDCCGVYVFPGSEIFWTRAKEVAALIFELADETATGERERQMRKTKSQLRAFGQRPGSPASARHQPELTVAARRLAESVLLDLELHGVSVRLEEGRARFRTSEITPATVKGAIGTHGDLVEAFLQQQRPQGR